jgi:hypothetical protein
VRVAHYPGDEEFTEADLRDVQRQQSVALIAPANGSREPWARGWTRVPSSRTPHVRGVVYLAPEGH